MEGRLVPIISACVRWPYKCQISVRIHGSLVYLGESVGMLDGHKSSLELVCLMAVQVCGYLDSHVGLLGGHLNTRVSGL